MSTQEKKTPEKEPVKVTSGFVAAKPVAAEKPEQKEPATIGALSADEAAAHEKRMLALEEQYDKRKAEIAAEEKEMLRKQQERAATMEGKLAKELAAAKESRDDHPTNSRGAPIPVEEQAQRVRHISEIDSGYNGKDDTIREL